MSSELPLSRTITSFWTPIQQTFCGIYCALHHEFVNLNSSRQTLPKQWPARCVVTHAQCWVYFLVLGLIKVCEFKVTFVGMYRTVTVRIMEIEGLSSNSCCRGKQ